MKSISVFVLLVLASLTTQPIFACEYSEYRAQLVKLTEEKTAAIFRKQAEVSVIEERLTATKNESIMLGGQLAAYRDLINSIDKLQREQQATAAAKKEKCDGANCKDS